MLRPAAYNALALLAFFFGLQGLAVVAFYTRRLAAPHMPRGMPISAALIAEMPTR